MYTEDQVILAFIIGVVFVLAVIVAIVADVIVSGVIFVAAIAFAYAVNTEGYFKPSENVHTNIVDASSIVERTGVSNIILIDCNNNQFVCDNIDQFK